MRAPCPWDEVLTGAHFAAEMARHLPTAVLLFEEIPGATYGDDLYAKVVNCGIQAR